MSILTAIRRRKQEAFASSRCPTCDSPAWGEQIDSGLTYRCGSEVNITDPQIDPTAACLLIAEHVKAQKAQQAVLDLAMVSVHAAHDLLVAEQKRAAAFEGFLSWMIKEERAIGEIRQRGNALLNHDAD